MHTNAGLGEVPVPIARVGAFQGRAACSPSFAPETITPYIQAFVLLQGEQRFTLDGMPFAFEAGHAGRSVPVAGIFCVAKPTDLTFMTETDIAMRKVRISAPLGWMNALAGGEGARVPQLARFFSGHLSRHVFPAHARLVDLAEQILNPPPSLAGEFLSLYRQSRGLEILSHVCRSLVESEGAECARALGRAQRQSKQARDYIMAHLSEDLTLGRVARETGASERNLQRSFKEHYGVTIGEFIRQSRLEAARDALERQGTSIAQAAYIAGYAHHSNFTTAFKRAYGVPPKFRRG